MYQIIDKHTFIDELLSDEYANWSYDGAEKIYEYLTDLEEETGDNFQFDRVAIRCEFTEYENYKELARDYGKEYAEHSDILAILECDNGHVIVNHV